MRADVFVVCLIVSFMRDVKSFESIRDIVFPRVPEVNRVRSLDDDQALEDSYTVLDTVGLVEQHGYPAEEHNITTDDGYNIRFFRISGSPLSTSNERKLVVFMQHGLSASSDTWVLLGPGRDLAFLLADAGYDVWLGNSRGNSYGRSHRNFSTLDKMFWDFSFHEMSTLDLPKMIDYALERSGQNDLFYIGHSMGTTMSYVLLSEKPEYNGRMRLVVSMSPIAFWKEKLNLFYRLLVDSGDLFKKCLDSAEIYDFGAQTKNNARAARIFCSDGSITQPLCISLLGIIAGKDTEELNSTLLPYLASYYPAGGSTKTLFHLQKNVESGILQKFDYGDTENVRIYGKKKAPVYKLKNISAPFALIWGRGDALSLESNVDELAKRLQNIVTVEAAPSDHFNHMDFLWAIHAKELIYDRIINIMSMYAQ